MSSHDSFSLYLVILNAAADDSHKIDIARKKFQIQRSDGIIGPQLSQLIWIAG